MGFSAREHARQCAQGAALTTRMLDSNIAEAARRFYKSPMWFGAYMERRVPIEHWQEYLDLRDAILERQPTFRLAETGSWRWRLARLIAGF